jgi:hypothetical protein
MPTIVTSRVTITSRTADRVAARMDMSPTVATGDCR